MADGPPLTRDELLDRLLGLIDAVRVPHPIRVAVDGPDAAGKTTLAGELADALRDAGRDVLRASADGFHRPRNERHARGADSAAGYYEDAFDSAALRSSLLDPLGDGGGRLYRSAVFDLLADAPRDSEPATAAEDAILVVDGVFLLRPELRDAWEVRIFVDAGANVRLARAVQRDAAAFGSIEEVERRYRARYLPAQELYFEQARPDLAADAIVVNDDPAAPRLILR